MSLHETKKIFFEDAVRIFEFQTGDVEKRVERFDSQ